jgi:hypothetical protein
MSRTPIHVIVKRERDAGDQIPEGASGVSRVRQTMLGMAGNLTPAQLAAECRVDPTTVSTAFANLHAVGYVLEVDGAGAYHVANLEHEPQPRPRKAPLLSRPTRQKAATTAPAVTVTNGTVPPIGARVRVTALRLEDHGHTVHVELADDATGDVYGYGVVRQ